MTDSDAGATEDSDVEPIERALELLAEVDSGLRAQATGPISDVDASSLDELERTLDTVGELVEQQRQQKSLTDTVRDAVSQRVGTDDGPDIETAVDSVTEFHRQVIETRRQEAMLDRGFGGLAYGALSLAYDIDDPVEEHVEEARELAENGDRYLRQFDTLRETYRTFQDTYEDAEPALARVEVNDGGRAGTYLVFEPSEIDELEPPAEIFTALAQAIGRIVTGRAAFESENWQEAAETLRTATERLEDGYRLLDRVEQQPNKNPFEAVLGRSFDESDLRRTEQGLSELLELTREFHEAARTAADGDSEAATDRYEATVDRLDDLSYN